MATDLSVLIQNGFGNAAVVFVAVLALLGASHVYDKVVR